MESGLSLKGIFSHQKIHVIAWIPPPLLSLKQYIKHGKNFNFVHVYT